MTELQHHDVVTVAEDGSIRLPTALRGAPGFQPGDWLRVRVDTQQHALVLTPGVDIRSLFGFIKTQTQGVRIEDMDPGAGPMPYQDQVAPDEE